MSEIAKTVLFLGVILIAYGYVCQNYSIYFFWESGVIGWFLLLLGSISFLLNRIDKNHNLKNNAIIEKIAVYILAFILLLKCILFGLFAASDAFEAASTYLKTDSRIKHRVGHVSGIILFSEGEINTSSNSEGEQGQGILTLVAKGQSRYELFEVHLIKKYETPSWQVIEATPID